MKRILVIEDEAPIRANLIRFMRLEGYEAFEAEDGLRGVAVALEVKPDLIFCDFMMPKMNGFEVLDKIRSHPDMQNLPFFFLSASAEPERFELAMEKGALGYLTKPFTLDQLREVLAKHLGSDSPEGGAA